MQTIFRLSKKKHTSTALSGEGSRISGGRWNPKGIPTVYTSSHLSLALLETLVHLDYLEDSLDYFAVKFQVPSNLIKDLATTLPSDWDMSDITVKIGADWLKSAKSLVLKVPSVVVPQEFNYLINPLHPDISKIETTDMMPVEFDPRLFKNEMLRD